MLADPFGPKTAGVPLADVLLFQWDPKTQSYVPVTTIQPGTAVWVYAPMAATIRLYPTAG